MASFAPEPPVDPLPPGLAEALASPDAHPEDPVAGVRTLQTHISHVYLTERRVYKLRKAVSLGFVDFGTRAARNADCAREVRLNRRLAPDVYLGVAAVHAESGGFVVGALLAEPTPEALAADRHEHVVVMRRLADGCDGLSLLERGALHAGHLDRVAHVLAAFHARHGLGAPSPWSAAAWRERVLRPMSDCLDWLESGPEGGASRATCARVRRLARGFLDARAAAFESRRLDGRAVDGHGDVHLQHVWFEPDRPDPLLIDCIEFQDDLRRIDAAAEVAFLAMDLEYRRRPALAARFLRRYAGETDDFDLYRVVDYYVAYRAAVRAKVAAIAAADARIAAAQRGAAARSARRHLALAARALAPRGRGAAVLVAGVVGTGKSTVADVLADASPGVVVASDRVRKRRAGLADDDRSGAASGLYTDAARDAVYAALLERAAPVVESGRVAILDATWALERHRQAAGAWARARGIPLWIVEARCEPDTARARLARRAALGRDPSDAGPERYERSAAAFQALRRDEGTLRAVATDAPRWRAAVRTIARELRTLAAARAPLRSHSG
jgi:aminoglycoside phosphotransferase family enzyme/predicted kinase